MATCKHCTNEYHGPSVEHITYSQYCQSCKTCAKCFDQIDPAALAFGLRYSIEFPLLCTNCQSIEYREAIENRRIPITVKELDWLNRVRLLIDINMDISVDTNMRTAELAAEGWIADLPLESTYVFLRRMEAIAATVAVALKRDRSAIKLKLEEKEREKYQSAASTSKSQILEQCHLCKKRFKLTELAEHKAKCKGDMTTPERKKLTDREKVALTYKNLGMTDEQVEATLADTFDKIRGQVKR